MNTPLRLVVFDIDGTLIDSQDFIIEAMTRAFGDLGVPMPTRAEVLSIVGLSLERAIAQLVPELNSAQLDAAALKYRDTFVAMRAERGGEAASPLYPGARAALEVLHEQDEVLLGVATGKAKRGLDFVCAAHDLDGYFVTRQTSDLHPSKPHPSMVIAALAETGVAAQNAVMVGDTHFDIEMGRAAGCRTIGVSWGYHPVADLHAAGADIVIDRFDQLEQALATLWGQGS